MLNLRILCYAPREVQAWKLLWALRLRDMRRVHGELALRFWRVLRRKHLPKLSLQLRDVPRRRQRLLRIMP